MLWKWRSAFRSVKMYRIPKDKLPCKFSYEWQEVLGERWMGSCPMWECNYEGTDEVWAEVEKHLVKVGGNECNISCAGFAPVETKICPKHDEEFYDYCGKCMEGEYAD
jgi:hypothetical protein